MLHRASIISRRECHAKSWTHSRLFLPLLPNRTLISHSSTSTRSPHAEISSSKGASRYDVRIGGGKEVREKRTYVVRRLREFYSIIRSECGLGGRGSKKPKMLRTSYLEAPKPGSLSARQAGRSVFPKKILLEKTHA